MQILLKYTTGIQSRHRIDYESTLANKLVNFCLPDVPGSEDLQIKMANEITEFTKTKRKLVSNCKYGNETCQKQMQPNQEKKNYRRKMRKKTKYIKPTRVNYY